jgi:hypothetical protein
MADSLELGRAELEERLRELDRAVGLLYPGQTFRLVLVGGGAMVLLGYLPRATADLDALDVPRELADLLSKYDINQRVVAYQHNFAYNLEDRLVLLNLGTESVECYSASLEDVVASKLHSPRDVDAMDVRYPEVLEALDWDRLAEVVDDMADSRLNDRQHGEFMHSYQQYREEFGPCDT